MIFLYLLCIKNFTISSHITTYKKIMYINDKRGSEIAISKKKDFHVNSKGSENEDLTILVFIFLSKNCKCAVSLIPYF